MKDPKRRTSRATVSIASVALLVLSVHARDVLAQASPESIDYEGPGSMSLMDELRKGAKIGTMLRGSYFSRTKPNRNGPTAEAGGVGGWLFGETGEYANFLSFGGALAYVAKVHGPEGHGGNFVLEDPDQSSYATLGVIFARLRAGGDSTGRGVGRCRTPGTQGLVGIGPNGTG